MKTKYDVGDEVLIKAAVVAIVITGDCTVYNLKLPDSVYPTSSISEYENDIRSNNSVVPISELRNLYKKMGNDRCREMLLDVIESYDVKGDK